MADDVEAGFCTPFWTASPYRVSSKNGFHNTSDVPVRSCIGIPFYHFMNFCWRLENRTLVPKPQFLDQSRSPMKMNVTGNTNSQNYN